MLKSRESLPSMCTSLSIRRRMLTYARRVPESLLHHLHSLSIR